MIIYKTGIRPIDALRQVTSFIIIDDQDVTRYWHANTPILVGADLQTYLESHIDDYWCGLMRKEYKGAVIEQLPNETLRQAWERWIAGGCVNPDSSVIIRIPFQITTSEDLRIIKSARARSNFKAAKAIQIERLLKKGDISKAISLKGGL